MLDDAKFINIDAATIDYEMCEHEQQQVAPPFFLVDSMETGLSSDLHE